MKVTLENMHEILSDYVDRIIDGMDIGTMAEVLAGYIENDKLDYSPEQLETEIREYYPELLEDDDAT